MSPRAAPISLRAVHIPLRAAHIPLRAAPNTWHFSNCTNIALVGDFDYTTVFLSFSWVIFFVTVLDLSFNNFARFSMTRQQLYL